MKKSGTMTLCNTELQNRLRSFGGIIISIKRLKSTSRIYDTEPQNGCSIKCRRANHVRKRVYDHLRDLQIDVQKQVPYKTQSHPLLKNRSPSLLEALDRQHSAFQVKVVKGPLFLVKNHPCAASRASARHSAALIFSTAALTSSGDFPEK